MYSLNTAAACASRKAGAIALTAVLLVGCSQALRPRVEPVNFTTQAEAGTGHVAVMSVAPWQDVVADLQPRFTLKAEDALTKAVATTAATERKLLDMLKVVMSVATPSSGTTLTKTSKSSTSVDDTGKVTSTSDRSRDSTEEEKPGEAKDFTPTLPGTLSASGLPGINSILEKKPEISTGAQTQYLLGTALFEEVQLLNHYLEYATTRDGYSPYLVRLQVSVMPSVRNEACDAYTTIGFFPSDENVAGAPRGTGARSNALPAVVPLLVTDDLEAALASDSADVVRQYALALSALIKGFSARGDVERYTDELVTTVTRDYNSLYQVARLTENSVRVRMGARLHSSGNYFLVPQTHNVTLLLLAPKDWDQSPTTRKVIVEAKTEFRDVKTGVALDSRYRNSTLAQYRTILGYFGFDEKTIGDDVIFKLTDAAGINDYPTFRACVQRLWSGRTNASVHRPNCPDCVDAPLVEAGFTERTARRLWVGFAGVAVGGQYASTAFSLPQGCKCMLPTALGESDKGVVRVFGVDDGEATLSLDLRPTRGIQESRLGVRLLILETIKAASSPINEADAVVSVPARTVTFDKAGQVLHCVFPNLSRVSGEGGSGSAIELVRGKSPKYSMVLQVMNRSLACEPCAFCSSEPQLLYPVSVAFVSKDAKKPEKATIAEVSALPALRGCGCGDVPFRFKVARAQDTPAGEVRIRLQFSFVASDGKAPASGLISAPLTDLSALNQFDVTIAAVDKETFSAITLSQLADGSTLHVAATQVLSGAGFQAKLVGTSTDVGTLIFVTGTCPKCNPPAIK